MWRPRPPRGSVPPWPPWRCSLAARCTWSTSRKSPRGRGGRRDARDERPRPPRHSWPGRPCRVGTHHGPDHAGLHRRLGGPRFLVDAVQTAGEAPMKRKLAEAFYGTAIVFLGLFGRPEETATALGLGLVWWGASEAVQLVRRERP